MTKQKASVIALELLLVALALMAVSWAAGLLDSLNWLDQARQNALVGRPLLDGQ
jgi:hypothetical protein